ncbi:hypothetical protein ACK3TF_002881 [Chlorella vulgaris]
MDTVLKALGLKSGSSSTVGQEEVLSQSNAVKVASAEGVRGAGIALATSTAVILGACKLFPSFNRSLSVSGKTALIVTPAFASFFLLAELKMNEFKKHKQQAWQPRS